MVKHGPFGRDEYSEKFNSKLSFEQNALVERCKNGKSSLLLAVIFFETFSLNYWGNFENILIVLKNYLKEKIVSPEIAAAISQCFLHNSKICKSFRDESKSFADFTLIQDFKKLIEEDPEHFEGLMEFSNNFMTDDEAFQEMIGNSSAITPFNAVEQLNALANEVIEQSKSSLIDQLDEFNSKTKLELNFEEKFNFIESKYGILIPNNSKLNIGNSRKPRF